MKIFRLAGRALSHEISDCVASLDASAPSDYRELAGLLASEWRANPPKRVGLAGGQGAGKSTLARLIASACERMGLKVCVLSLDDFYFPLAIRQELAERVHPLLETRGPAGTHDMAACRSAVERLGRGESVEIPVFNKGLDDREGSRYVQGPVDLVLVEGWCVGARPESAPSLQVDRNALERERDAEGIWRRYVNESLKAEYERTWAMLDYLVYLRVPSLAAVRRWRLLQEENRPADQRLDAEAIDLFVQHYERTTTAMIGDLPSASDLVVDLAEDHSISAISLRSP